MANYQEVVKQVEAIKWTGTNEAQVTALIGTDYLVGFQMGGNGTECVVISNANYYYALAEVGQYIVKESSGQLSYYDEAAFNERYVLI